MLPFLAPILAQGLNLIANAALVKGKDWVKNKTGVDLEQASLSNEELTKLKQFELENELELQKLKLEDNKLDAELEKLRIQDVDSARSMQKVALAQDDIFSKRFVYYLTIFWSLLSGAYIMLITFADIPEKNVRFADTVLGFMLGTLISTIFGFFYGSSKSSQHKDEVIRGVLENVNGN